jgi:hypothetical protein
MTVTWRNVPDKLMQFRLLYCLDVSLALVTDTVATAAVSANS